MSQKEPDDMSRTARNKRLYECLVSQGLCVEAVPRPGGEGIEFLRVSSVYPCQSSQDHG